MKNAGHALNAIRLDSGDLLDLSRKARALLDNAGLANVRIFASGGLDEFEVEALVQARAPIDVFGVGTKAGVSADAPWTDCAYKLAEYDGRPVLKLSTKKQTLPGQKQVFRFRDAGGLYLRDVIGCQDETVPQGAEALLNCVMRHGRRRQSPASLTELRARFRTEYSCLQSSQKGLHAPACYDVHISAALSRLQEELVLEVREREIHQS